MFINEIKKEGVKDFLFDELKFKNEMNFNSVKKMSSQETANEISKSIIHGTNQRELIEINRSPFLFGEINKSDIMDRLNLMTPDNGYVVFHSKNNKDEMTKNPKLFQTEKYYHT